MTNHPPPAREGARRPVRQLLSGLRSLPSVELRLLLPIAIILAGLTFFAQIAQSATLAEPNRFDTALLLLFRNPQDLGDPRGPVWFEEMVRDFTAFGSTGPLAFLTAAATGYFLLRRNYHMAGLVLITVLGGYALTLLLKEGFDRPRPVLVPRGTYVSTQSFPSGHSSIAAAVYLTLGVLVARLQRGRRLRVYVLAVALLLAFFVGLSRVYLGVHYPSDVLGGWTIGAVWATMMLVASRWWRGRRTVADAQME